MDVNLFVALRKINALTQSDMAKQLRVSRQLISMIEISERKISPQVEQRVLYEFGRDHVEDVRALTDMIKKQK